MRRRSNHDSESVWPALTIRTTGLRVIGNPILRVRSLAVGDELPVIDPDWRIINHRPQSSEELIRTNQITNDIAYLRQNYSSRSQYYCIPSEMKVGDDSKDEDEPLFALTSDHLLIQTPHASSTAEDELSKEERIDKAIDKLVEFITEQQNLGESGAYSGHHPLFNIVLKTLFQSCERARLVIRVAESSSSSLEIHHARFKKIRAVFWREWELSQEAASLQERKSNGSATTAASSATLSTDSEGSRTPSPHCSPTWVGQIDRSGEEMRRVL